VGLEWEVGCCELFGWEGECVSLGGVEDRLIDA
jgi:hypothetical protein